MFGDTVTPSDIVRQKLSPWLNNPPDYHDVKDTYEQFGKIRAAIRTLEREISKIEDKIGAESDKPRGNDTKKAKVEATTELKDKLAVLEAQCMELEAHIKFLEYAKVMYNAASFQSRAIYE